MSLSFMPCNYYVVLKDPEGRQLEILNKNNLSDDDLYEDVTLDTCKFVGQPPYGRTLTEALADPIRIHASFYRSGEDDEALTHEALTQPERHLFNKTVLTAFVGYCPRMVNGCGNYGSEYDGNTLLCWLEDGSFLHIGRHIATFRSKDNRSMVRYVSSVGGEPNAYSIDSNGDYYLMWGVCIRSTHIDGKWILSCEQGDWSDFQQNPYHWYGETYGNGDDLMSIHKCLPEDIRSDYPVATIVRKGLVQVCKPYCMFDHPEEGIPYHKISVDLSIKELADTYDGPDIRPDWGEEIKLDPFDSMEIILVMKNGKLRRVTMDEYDALGQDLQERIGVTHFHIDVIHKSDAPVMYM